MFSIFGVMNIDLKRLCCKSSTKERRKVSLMFTTTFYSSDMKKVKAPCESNHFHRNFWLKVETLKDVTSETKITDCHVSRLY